MDADYRARWAGKFDWVHADEYQDVNFAQYTWLKTLASHGRRMFVVGDDDQSIYGWRGADVAFIRRFKLDFPDAVDIRLEELWQWIDVKIEMKRCVYARSVARLQSRSAEMLCARSADLRIVHNFEAELLALIQAGHSCAFDGAYAD